PSVLQRLSANCAACQCRCQAPGPPLCWAVPALSPSAQPLPGTPHHSAAALLSFCCFCRLFSSSLSPFLSIISRFFLSINSGRGAIFSPFKQPQRIPPMIFPCSTVY